MTVLLLGITVPLVSFVVIRTVPFLLKKPASPQVLNASIVSQKDQWATTQLSRLTIREKVGQLFMFPLGRVMDSSASADTLAAIQPGGILISGRHTKNEVASITASLSRVPFFVKPVVALDAEGGVVERIIDDNNPGAPALAKLADDAFCQTIASHAAMLAQIGIHLPFNTVADIGTPGGFIASRTFGESPRFVANRVKLAITCNKKTLTSVKHFPGHGRTPVNSHREIPIIALPLAEWRTSDARPFEEAIRAGVDTLMLGHLQFPDIASEPASLSPTWIQKARDMGFDGVIITDDLGMLEPKKNPLQTLDEAIAGGADMLLYMDTAADPNVLYDHALTKIQQGLLSEKELDSRVTRILRMKYHVATER